MFRWFCIILISLPTTISLRAQDGIPAKTLTALKAAMVYIKVEGHHDEESSGSGFLVHAKGTTGFIATNRHVVTSGPKHKAPKKITVVFSSGTAREKSLTASLLVVDPDQDLAILQITQDNLPTPIEVASAVELRETLPVYSLGFPLGEVLARGRTNPAVTISRANISSLHEDAQGRVQSIQLDGELNPGNSGGPIVDSQGKLVGVAVSKIVGTAISFAIPHAELQTLVRGRAGKPILRKLKPGNDEVVVEVEVPLIDPLQQISQVELRHGPSQPKEHQPTQEGTWPLLTDGTQLALKVEKGKATGSITMKTKERKPTPWAFQSLYSQAGKELIATAPQVQSIDFTATAEQKLDGLMTLPWHLTKSRDGIMAVDLPGKPSINVSETIRTSVGMTRMTLIGCENENGTYLAFRMMLPTLPPRDDHRTILKGMRDSFASTLKGKVVREKETMSQRRYMGLDCTIEAKDDTRGERTVRARFYLIGKTLYIMMVISPSHCELPEDMGRFLGSLALDDFALRATGILIPDPAGKELEGWGTALDPDNDCTFTPTKNSLEISLPGTMHDMAPTLKKVNAPRVMREIEGDFTLQVKVKGDFVPGQRSTFGQSVPYLAGGIMVFVDSENYIRFERAVFRRGTEVLHSVAYMETEGGQGGAVHNGPGPRDDYWLRLERKGTLFEAALSTDGKRWGRLKPIDTVWPGKVKVGLHAISTSSDPFTVHFEDFSLKTAPKR